MANHVGVPWWKDAAERVAWTFVEAALAVVILGNILELETWQGAAVAGATAALAVVKSFAAKKIGKDDAAILPAGRPYTDPH